jgi:putative membrane protein
MKLIINDEKEKRLNRFVDWVIYMVGYAIVLISASLIFKKTIHFDDSNYGVWFLMAAIIVYILSKTIKPILIWLTLPLTGITMGLFYPFINVIILYITDGLLGSHFEIRGIFMAFIVAVFISVINIIMQKGVIEPLIRKER